MHFQANAIKWTRKSPLGQDMEWRTCFLVVTVRKVHRSDGLITKPLADRVQKNLVRCGTLIHSALLEHAVLPWPCLEKDKVACSLLSAPRAEVSAGILVYLSKTHLSSEKPSHCQYKFPEDHVMSYNTTTVELQPWILGSFNSSFPLLQ